MKNILVFLALFLAACGGGSSLPPPPIIDPVPAQATSPAWKMPPGSYAEYKDRQLPGVVDQTTGVITVVDDPAVPFFTIRVTNLAAPNGQILRVLSAVGVALTAIGPDGGWMEASTGVYIGESGDGQGNTLIPPEPLLTLNPVVGEVISVTTVPSNSPPLVETYRTISINAGVVKATLVERPDTAPRAYTFEFDGELKTAIFGDVKKDGTVDATVLERISVGQNP